MLYKLNNKTPFHKKIVNQLNIGKGYLFHEHTEVGNDDMKWIQFS